MVRTIARILGLLMIANAIFDFTYPTFAADFFRRGAGRRWRFLGREIMENVACLTPTTRRYIAVWEGLVGVLLMALASEERPAEVMTTAGGAVRIPIEHVRT